MKKFFLSAISLCAAAALAAGSALPASAEAAAYPDIGGGELAFTSITDYAVDGENLCAVAEGKKITVLKDGVQTVHTFDYEVDSLDYSEGKFYHSFTSSESSKSYHVLPDVPGQLGETARFEPHTFSLPYTPAGSQYTYNIDGSSGILYIWDGKSTAETKSDGKYSLLKEYGGKVYVVKTTTSLSQSSVLCTVDGTTVTDYDMTYKNYPLLEEIPEGGSAKALKAFSPAPSIKHVESADITELDLEELKEGASLPVVSPKEHTQEGYTGNVLLLCSTDIAAIIAVGDKAYMCDASKISPLSDVTLSEPETASATVNSPEWAYSLPFISGATKLFKIETGEKVTVTKKLSSADFPQLAHDFYLVEKETGEGQTEQGYVAKEFLELASGGGYNESGSSTIGDPSPSEDDYVKTVVLVLAVVLLVLLGAGYLIWISTSGKSKKSDKPEEDAGDKK